MKNHESKPYIEGVSNPEDFAPRTVPKGLNESTEAEAHEVQEQLVNENTRRFEETKRPKPPNYNRDKPNARGNFGREMGDKYADQEENEGLELKGIGGLEGVPDDISPGEKPEFEPAHGIAEKIEQALDSGAGIGALNMEDLAEMGIDFSKFYGEKDVEELLQALNERTGEKWDDIRSAINEGLKQLLKAGAEEATLAEYIKRLLTFSSIAFPEDDREVAMVVQDGVAKILPLLLERTNTTKQKAA